jgi:hypothetical protein
MAKAKRVLSTPRRTASEIKATKRARKVDLAAAAAELTAIDDSIEAMHKKYDDADSRKDYRRLSDRRFDLLHIFGSTPALSLGDIEAKASALSHRTLEDYANTALIAKSLAQDILKGQPLMGGGSGDNDEGRGLRSAPHGPPVYAGGFSFGKSRETILF